MRRAALVVFLSLAAVAAAAPPEGRWAGHAQLPGRSLPLVVDIAPGPSGGWIGSLTIPGQNIKGAELAQIALDGDRIAIDGGTVLSLPAGGGGVTFKARVEGTAIVGEMDQAGNKAPFRLVRTGPAQVDQAARSAPVASSTQGRWIGEFELGGYPRHVTLDIANDGANKPKVELVVVGKQVSRLPIDLVNEEEGILHIESRLYGTTLEARVSADRMEGTLEVGANEIPILLRRSAEKTS
ncbi:MAG TPA: hypothetical protein VLL50_03370 [Usitatibacter sp.]|nr:hypothetical protein [Usitatibacter sp.]